MAEKKQSYFEVLNGINVNDKTEVKEGLTYLSWSFAVGEVLKKYPDMTYEVEFFDGKPFLYDELTGYMVFTNVTIEGITRRMWLPVMDSKNKTLKSAPYTYKTKNGDKTVAAATMFDINKTIMRCLVKNFAMFGLGLYIYSGEDIPEVEAEEEKRKAEAEAEEKKRLSERAKTIISPLEVTELEALAEKAESVPLKVTHAYKVNNFAEMTFAQYEDCKRKLEYKIEKKAEAEKVEAINN